MDGYFFKVYKCLFLIKELTFIDVLVLSTIIQYHESEKTCYLQTTDFMYDCNAKRRTIERSFQHLKALNLIAITKIDGKFAKMLRTSVLERKLGYNKGIQDKETERVINALKEKWKKQ